MNSEQQRQVDLVTRLSEKTAERKIAWEVESARAVRAELGGYIVRVLQIDSNEFPDALDYHVLIEDRSGVAIDAFADTDLHDFNNDFFNSYRDLNDTYNRARRQALGADQALEAILSALSDG